MLKMVINFFIIMTYNSKILENEKVNKDFSLQRQVISEKHGILDIFNRKL